LPSTNPKAASDSPGDINVNKLVFYEAYDEIIEAIKREKQIKGGSRQRKDQFDSIR
jgi:predicted GIY-YIG superfamily endonuclease